jgi:hypothetical protein
VRTSVEQVHHLRAVGLQFLDDLLARQQARLLLVELVDLLDLLLDLGDLALQIALRSFWPSICAL